MEQKQPNEQTQNQTTPQKQESATVRRPRLQLQSLEPRTAPNAIWGE